MRHTYDLICSDQRPFRNEINLTDLFRKQTDSLFSSKWTKLVQIVTCSHPFSLFSEDSLFTLTFFTLTSVS